MGLINAVSRCERNSDSDLGTYYWVIRYYWSQDSNGYIRRFCPDSGRVGKD